MKLIETFAYVAYKVFLSFTGFAALISIVLIAEKISWYYLLLYVPVIYYGLSAERVNTNKKRPKRLIN